MRMVVRWYYRIHSVFIHHKEAITFISLYIFIAVWFFHIAFTTQYLGGDFIRYTVPTYYFVLQQIKTGVIPLWQPYSFLGVPLLFQSGGAFFYPVLWFFFFSQFIFNPNLHMNLFGKSLELYLYFHIVLGASGMFLLLRRKLLFSPLASFAGGLIFGFSVFMTGSLGDNTAVLLGKVLLPYIIYCLIEYIEKGGFARFILFVTTIYLLLIFGYPYYQIYFVYACLGLAIFFGRNSVIKTVIGIGCAVLLSGWFLIPALYTFTQAYRITGSENDPLFAIKSSPLPTYIINILIPQGLYGVNTFTWGVIPFVFLLSGFSHIQKNKFMIYFSAMFIISFVLSIGGYIGIEKMLGGFPFFIDKLRSHGQMEILMFFSGIVIIASGIDASLLGLKNRVLELILWIIFILLVGILLFIPLFCPTCQPGSAAAIAIGRMTILFGAGVLLYTLTARFRSKSLICVALVLTLFEFHYYYSKVEYLGIGTSYAKYFARNSLIPEIPSSNNLFRYIFAQDNYTYNSSAIGVFNYLGYEGIPYYGAYSIARFGFPREFQIANVKYAVTTTPINNPSYTLINTILPSQHPLETILGPVPDSDFLLPRSTQEHYIYKINNYLPRFYVPQKVQTCSDALSCNQSEDPPEIVYVKEKGIAIDNPKTQSVSMKVSSYTPNVITLSIVTQKRTFIASSEIWDKGWHVTVNGIQSRVFNVSDGFRGFIVPQGRSAVVMYYSPAYFELGILLTIMGILTLLIRFKYGFLREKIIVLAHIFHYN